MREWLSGGASPCQGEGRGFDPRLALIFLQKYRSCLQFALYVILWAGPMFLQREVQAPLKPLMK